MTGALRLAILLLVMACGAAGITLQFFARPHAPEVVTINSARFIKSDEAAPPRNAQWAPVDLPDNWGINHPGQSGYGWYVATFNIPQAPADAWAVYLPTVSTTYQLYINGVDAGTGGGMTGAIERSMGVPRLDVIAPQLLLAGGNVLYLRLRVAPNLRGGLGPITLGPRVVLEPLYDNDYFVRVTVPRSLNIALIFAGLLVLMLWLRRPQASLYGYFAALAIVWSVRNFHYTVSLPRVPSNLIEAFILGSLGVVVVLLWLFMLRFTGTSWPRTERAVKWGCAVLVLLMPWLPPLLANAIRIPWYLLCALLGAFSIAILLRFGLRPENRQRIGVWVIVAAELIALALGLTDFAVSAHLLPFGPAARLAYAAPLLLFALVYAMADGYFHTYDEVRSLNTDLERRVGDRTLELQRTHERVRALERVSTLASERDRMMRDMHDGIGSQLITTLDAVERGGSGPQDVAGMLRACIDDLRLMIDSLEPGQESLQSALANLRWRLEPRLAEAGLVLDWQVQEGVALTAPDSVLQVLRIVQEGVTNVLKHAGATRLRVSARPEGQWLLMEVEDDGRGIEQPALQSATPARAHRGLGNMRARAGQLGGSLDLGSSGVGTVLRLRVPMTA
ncbi:sensor histidine kinase [soil metagenome]